MLKISILTLMLPNSVQLDDSFGHFTQLKIRLGYILARGSCMSHFMSVLFFSEQF